MLGPGRDRCHKGRSGACGQSRSEVFLRFMQGPGEEDTTERFNLHSGASRWRLFCDFRHIGVLEDIEVTDLQEFPSSRCHNTTAIDLCPKFWPTRQNFYFVIPEITLTLQHWLWFIWWWFKWFERRQALVQVNRVFIFDRNECPVFFDRKRMDVLFKPLLALKHLKIIPIWKL